MSSDGELNVNDQELDSEDEMDWEEVDVQGRLEIPLEERPPIEIILEPLEKKKGKGKEETKKKGITHEERLMRINCHKIHTVVLLANAKIRNQWINDELLQARLMSLTPITLQNEFAQIHPSRYPDKGHRGHLFERALQHLVQWWSQDFFEVLPTGHIRNHTFDEIQSKLERLGILYDEKELDDDTLEDILDTEIERIRSPKSLMKHALNRSGSRDVSAQLFTSLCRGLGLPARLVVSLQSVPWQPSAGKPKPTYTRKDTKGKGKAKQPMSDQEEGSSSNVDVKGKGKASAFKGAGSRLDGAPVPMSEKARGKQRAEPVVKLRKQKDKGNRLGSVTPTPSTSRLASPDPRTTPPVFWTEVFSRPDSRWMPVDPIRGIVNKRKAFDPTPIPTYTAPGQGASLVNTGSLLPSRPQVKTSATQAALPKGVKQENRLLYVMAFEEDGYARDVTRRYAREFNAKIAKNQGGSNASNTGGKARRMWWESVCGLVKRPYQLNRDDLEDEELMSNQMSEGMPSTIAGFKDHPLYVLARHLKQTEVIHPPPPSTPELGKFRGEPVYPRSSVVPLKSAETWMRQEGRIVKAGCQPLKTIKARPGTLNRQREVEVRKGELKDAGVSVENAEVMQGLYARDQTEVYIPPPLVDGKIPKNDFGNIDLYVPTMLPKGAVHIPYKGTAKIAKKLGFDYAEAVTGFEFRKRKANAVIEGIVIAAENESALLEAFWEHQRVEDEKARKKKEEKALQLWTKLVHGLRIRQRLQAEYADKLPPPKPSKKAIGKSKRSHHSAASDQEDEDRGEGPSGSSGGGAGFLDLDDEDVELNLEHVDAHGGEGGGLLVRADDVVQAFHLPKYNPLILESSKDLFALGGGKRAHKMGAGRHNDDEGQDIVIDYETYDLDEHEAPDEMKEGEQMDVDKEDPAGVVGEPLLLGQPDLGGVISMQEMMEAESKSRAMTDEPAVEDLTPSVPRTQTPNGAGEMQGNGRKLRVRLPALAAGSGSVSTSARPKRAASSAKKRKRTPVEEEEDASADDDGVEDGGAESDWEAKDAAGEGDEDDAEVEEPEEEEDADDETFGSKKKSKSKGKGKGTFPRKKARGGATKPRTPRAGRTPKAPVAPAPPTDRVLRSKRSKVSV